MERTRLIAISAVVTVLFVAAVIATTTPRDPPAPNNPVTTVTLTSNGSIVVKTYTGGGVVCSNNCSQFHHMAAQSSIAIERLHVDSSSKIVIITVKNVGAVNVTLDGVHIQGFESNKGFNNTASMSLQSTLARGDEITITSVPLPNLTTGDTLDVKVTAATGVFASTRVTVP